MNAQAIDEPSFLLLYERLDADNLIGRRPVKDRGGMTTFDKGLDWLGKRIAERIRRAPKAADPMIHSDPAQLRRNLRPGDVLLVDSPEKVSAAVKYLTHSTWSHAALYVGDALGVPPDGAEQHALIEVNLGEGCVASPLSKYAHCNTRICRPLNLTDADREHVIGFMIERLGLQYDMRNVFDLARYLIPTPPVPVRWRRRMIALGSGEPSRAICSTLIAEASNRSATRSCRASSGARNSAGAGRATHEK